MFVTSRLDYCNALLAWCPSNSLNSLQLIQNTAVRVLTGINKKDVSPVLASLHWLPVKFWIKFKILLPLYKGLNGKAPRYLQYFITPHAPNRALPSWCAGLLVVPTISKSRLGRMPLKFKTFCHDSRGGPKCRRKSKGVLLTKSKSKTAGDGLQTEAGQQGRETREL